MRPASEDGARKEGATSGGGAADAANASLAAQLAVEHSRQLAVMRAMLKEAGVELPKSRRHPAQLLRFAATHGILTVQPRPSLACAWQRQRSLSNV